MAARRALRNLPGHCATGLASVTATMLVLVGTASMYYESWGQPLPGLIAPLLPGIVFLTLCLVALRWPGGGGALLFAAGAAFGAWWWLGQTDRDVSTSQAVFTLSLLIGPIVVTAGLFLLDARLRGAPRDEGATRPTGRWARYGRFVLVVTGPVLAAAILSVVELPSLLARLDDGLRGARTVEGNGVVLVWAPRGPGWNWRTSDGAYPSWNMIASYGVPHEPLHAGPEDMRRRSLCAFLDETGTTLLPEPVHVWRMPTADEIVRSLNRNGENAGCERAGESPRAECRVAPDKETPLWAPDEPPIYYWAADEYDSGRGVCVNYTGGINRQPKTSRERGTGFRCVRAPDERH